MDEITKFGLNVSSLKDFLDEIKEELRQFNSLVENQEDTQFVRRLKVRVMFSLIEAQVSHLKGTALAVALTPDQTFTKDEYLALHDYREPKKSSGAVNYLPAKLGFKESAKLAFSAFSKVLHNDHKLDFGSAEGQRFLSAVAIRDRIVHPKSAGDWKLSAADMDTINAAWTWFGENLVRAGKSVPQKRKGEISDEIQKRAKKTSS